MGYGCRSKLVTYRASSSGNDCNDVALWMLASTSNCGAFGSPSLTSSSTSSATPPHRRLGRSIFRIVGINCRVCNYILVILTAILHILAPRHVCRFVAPRRTKLQFGNVQLQGSCSHGVPWCRRCLFLAAAFIDLDLRGSHKRLH